MPKRGGYVDAYGFREARLIAGLNRPRAAQLLGVSVRTLRNWETRKTRVPYSAFKLMRILTGYALPGEAWAGFSVRGDTLWSPEGKGFTAHDLGWWSLTCAMARQFRVMHAAQMSRGGGTRAFAREVPPPRYPQSTLPPSPLAVRPGLDTPVDGVAMARERCTLRGLNPGAVVAVEGGVSESPRPPNSPAAPEFGVQGLSIYNKSDAAASFLGNST